MRFPLLVSISAIWILSPIAVLADAIVEGRVNLPKSHAPSPVMAKRYEIVTNGGVLATRPPLAVVYLDGSFPAPTFRPTKQVAQKDLTFLPPLLPVQVGTAVEFPNLDDTYHNIFSYSPPNDSISAAIVRKNGQFLQCFLMSQGWSRFDAIFTNTCVDLFWS